MTKLFIERSSFLHTSFYSVNGPTYNIGMYICFTLFPIVNFVYISKQFQAT